MMSIKYQERRLAFLLTLIVFIGGAQGLRASEEEIGAECGYFSKDPNDRSGPPIHFIAGLSADAQREHTDSPGKGLAEFVLNRDTLKLSWSVTYKDITSQPVALHVHGPVPAEGTAPPMFELAADEFGSPITGEKTLSMGEVAYLVQNLTYVNLHTNRYPAGELRGAVQRQRPAC